MAVSRRVLFFGFLGLGLLTGLFLGSLSRAFAAHTHADQQNALFILVDDFNNEHPALLGIWLAARQQGTSVWNWMPVYPTPLDENEPAYAEPHAAFYLPSSDFDDPSSLPPLRAQGAWWDEVYWMDEASLGVAQILAGSQPMQISDTWAEPQASLYEQVQALNAVCNGVHTAIEAGALDQLLALMPGHLRSSVSPFDIITSWDAWTQAGAPLSCSHPWAD